MKIIKVIFFFGVFVYNMGVSIHIIVQGIDIIHKDFGVFCLSLLASYLFFRLTAWAVKG